MMHSQAEIRLSLAGSAVGVLLCAFLSFSGCATLFGDSYDEITINSEPSGAKVTYRGREVGTTPVKFKMERTMQAPTVLLKKDGYRTAAVTLDREVTSVAFFNFGFFILSCGATSWGIDGLTGKMFEYAQDTYVFPLEKKTARNKPPGSGVEYFVRNYGLIQRDLAQGNESDEMQGACESLGLTVESCPALLDFARSEPTAVFACADGLCLYRLMDGWADSVSQQVTAAP